MKKRSYLNLKFRLRTKVESMWIQIINVFCKEMSNETCFEMNTAGCIVYVSRDILLFYLKFVYLNYEWYKCIHTLILCNSVFSSSNKKLLLFIQVVYVSQQITNFGKNKNYFKLLKQIKICNAIKARTVTFLCS